MRKRTTAALLGISALTVAGVAFGPASASSAHTPEVKPDCHGVTIDLTGYQVKAATTVRVVDVPEHPEQVLVHDAYDETVIDQPFVAGTPAIPAVPAVYGDAPLISAAVPEQPAVPAVTHVEYQFIQKITGKVRWERDPNWNAGANGKGWSKTGACKTVTDVAAKDAVPGKDAVYGEPPLITPAIPEQPAVPEIPEVSHVVPHEAVYDTVTVPATYRDDVVAGDDEPNSVSITTSDAKHSTHEDHLFGTSFSKTITFDDAAVANTYTVDVVAWDDPEGTDGWTRQFTGTTVPCEATTPPTTPPTDEPTTPPTGEPSTPAPSDGPTTGPTDSPSPTGATTPPAAVRNDTPAPAVNGSAKTPTAVRVAADTSHEGTLAYTGFDEQKFGLGALIGLGLIALGAAIIAIRHQRFIARRRREAGIEE